MYEYLSIVSPTKKECNKAIKEKSYFSDIYQAPSAKCGKPHIALAYFVQEEDYENFIIDCLNTAAMDTTVFPITLKNFGNFSSHCIYINIIDKMPFSSLTRLIKKSLKKNPERNIEFVSKFIHYPHLTIAAGLQTSQFEESWIEYSKKKYEGNFLAKNMQLLKRPVGGLKYEVIGYFEFKGRPGETTQPRLFN